MSLTARVRTAAVGLLLAVALAACAPIYTRHGYVPDDRDLAKITVGQSTTEDVGLMLGRPAAIGVMAGSSWYYVGSRFKQVGPMAPQEIDRQVVAISFDDAGKVSNVERFGLKEGQVIALNRRVTTTGVKTMGLLTQLLGNLGRFNASDLLNRN